ncbi:sugar phosphate isomerase/epimerase [Virgibacillus sp. NKC19-3]|uniref:sugar phosphate isomerase/epimerase family protein n=1 Tax=Virgibacillus saliphilus TaxID=2831674 RepID=UPI001C9B0B2C|nr:sugar phosphate isomerase/epimerase family protein [Virgibacillus sp. NKC19-3]MBY7142811.1 sugar phosphate isomerase/epimerase [Virgibacillus sp. NKC19-3]
MKLAFSTNAFTNVTLPQAVAEIGKCGYGGVEILADKPHAFPPTPNALWVDEVKRNLHDCQLEVSNINGNTACGFFRDPTGEPTFEPSLCNAQPLIRQKRIDYARQCIDLAVALGSSNISITSGICLPGNPPAQAFKYFVDSLQYITDYAEKHNINVGIEYEPGLLIENGEELLQIIKEVGSNKLGANLDLGHAVVGGENVPHLVEQMGPYIWNIHLEDILGTKHYHLIPGDGSMNFKAILQHLQSMDYRGFITIELYTYVDQPIYAAERSIAFLRPLMDKIKGVNV